MIYLVTNAPDLIKSERYENISIEKSLELLEPLRTVGVDTETEGFDVYTKKLLSLQLGCNEFQIVIDCLTVNVKRYKEYLESDRLFLFWNAKFDLKFLYHQGIIPISVWDGFLAEKLMWLGYPPGMHEMSLKAAGMNYLGIDLDKTVRGQIIDRGLSESVVEYAAFDVKYLEALKDKQMEKIIEKDLEVALRLENSFVRCLAYMEYCGVKLDAEKWKAKMSSDSSICEQKVAELNQWIVDNMEGKYVTVNKQGDLFGGFDLTPKCNINWKSSKQVIPIFEELGLDLKTIDPTTKKPKKSTDIKVIGPQKDKSALIPIFIEYKKAAILVDTFGEKFLDLINKKSGRIHPNFWQLGADTARLSSSEPNGQNLPSDKVTRSCFVAEAGNKILACDYKGQENFVMADVANDTAMINELMYGSGDLHSVAAKMIFKDIIPSDLPIEEVPTKFKKLRQEAKGYEFLCNYGGNDSTMSRTYSLTPERAKEIYDNYMEGFAGLRDYQKWARREVRQKGYILLNPITKHKAYIYDYDELKRLQKKQNEKGFWEYYREMKRDAPDCDTVRNVRKLAQRWAASEKQSINYRIQGTGAIMYKTASILLFKYLEENNLLFKVKYCIAVHDEIVLECPEELVEEVGTALVDCMRQAGSIYCKRVKLDADLAVGDYWIH